MKHFVSAILVLMFVISTFADAPSSSEKKTIEELAGALTTAYTSKKLGSLDAEKPYLGKVMVVIEHSLGNKLETKAFNTFKNIDKWLKSREREEFPSREIFALKQCRKGVCTYDSDGGILHNHLYIKKITYSYSKGRYYIKSIHLLDGD